MKPALLLLLAARALARPALNHGHIGSEALGPEPHLVTRSPTALGTWAAISDATSRASLEGAWRAKPRRRIRQQQRRQQEDRCSVICDIIENDRGSDDGDEADDADDGAVQEIDPSEDEEFPCKKGDGTIAGAFIGATAWIIATRALFPD